MRCVVMLAVVLACGGCSLGPKALESTHPKYAASVQNVEEQQFLSNVVRLRYVEATTELSVSAIATQYEVTAGAELRPFFSTEAARNNSPNTFGAFTRFLPFASLGVSNRPTISLTPQSEGSIVRQSLTPISGETIIFLAQSGWPVGSILRIWLDRLNGVPNAVPGSGPPRDIPSDFARFRRATDLMQFAQDQGLISVHSDERITELSGPLAASAITASAVVEAAKLGYEYRPRQSGEDWALIQREQRLVLQVNPRGRGSKELLEFAELVNLKPYLDRYELVVGSGVVDPVANGTAPSDSMKLTPRSTAQALFYLANGVEIPTVHIAAGLVRLPSDGTNPADATEGIFRVHSCKGNERKPPPCSYAAVWYRDHWFYLDDRDQESKATLFLMLQLRRLDFQRQQIGGIPALTLPVGR